LLIAWLGVRIKLTSASFAFAHRRPEIPLSSFDIYQRPRILEGFDLKMIFLIDLELTRWQECP
jgi:hypothetical protein